MLELTLFGPPAITIDGEPLILRPRNSIRARAILYYLAATGRFESRERLAGLLWSDVSDKRARDYLRGELYLLAALKDVYLLEHDGRLGLRPGAHTTDLTRVRAVLDRPNPSVDELDTALQLWSGGFLEGLDSALESSSPLYVEWLAAQRTEWDQSWRAALYRLAETSARTQQEYARGIAASSRLLALEPEREEVHRLKMRLLAQDGQRGAALRQYDVCTAALLNEMGVPPSLETTALYDQILSGELRATGAQAPEAPRVTPFQAPPGSTHFVGPAPRSQTTHRLAHPGAHGHRGGRRRHGRRRQDGAGGAGG